MNQLYNLGIKLFGTGISLAARRRPKVAKLKAGQAQVWDYLSEHIDRKSQYVWIHVASLGEFEQARPLIERLRRERPDEKILLTFFSPSGYEVRKNYPMVDAVCYLPLDTPSNALNFLNMVDVKMAIFVKYEFWGNYLEELRRRNIPTYIISAIFRDSQPFFKWWGGMFRNMLRSYATIYVQDEASRRRLAKIGFDNVVVAGDTRFDRVTDIMSTTVEMPEIEKFVAGAPLTLVVGSSWEADEAVYLPLLNRHPEIKLIIAPHEFNAERLETLRKNVAGKTMLYSEFEANPDADARCIIVDCFGKLASLYRYGDVAYVGGGFGAGIHNLNEAAVYGIPVMFGPNYKKFREAWDLIACGGGLTFASEKEFDEAATGLIENPEARREAGRCAGEYIKSQLGATDKIFAELF